jgi:hypothetical protein
MASVTASTPLIGATGAFAGVNVSGSFIPTLWSAKLNQKFYKSTVFGEIANTSYEGEISGLGDKVVINNRPDITISDYQVGTSLSYQVPAPSTVELPIDRAKYFAFQVNDVVEHQSQPKLMDMFSDDAAMQMKIAIDTSVLLGTATKQGIWNDVPAANQGATAGAISGGYNLGTATTPVTLTASNVLATLTALAGVLDEQNIPETERWLLIDPLTRQILMQSNLAQAQFMGDDKSMVRNGKIGMIDRFTVYVTNNLPKAAATQDYFGAAAAGTAKRRLIMAGHKSAVTFASQMTKMETVRNPSDFGDYVRGLNVYGYKTIIPTGLASALVA